VLFLTSFGYCYAQADVSENPYPLLKDTLFLGVPNCNLSEFGDLKGALSTLPDAKLIYTCEEEKRFVLLIKRKTYPDISAIRAKIKTVNDNLMIYEKTGGWKSFFAVCAGEIEKKK